ncbi:Pheromone receptor-like protein [Thalictrum thalictroides]|uniref:Pheromone receptor-like protein n=1 Tax=Thalictrum thalictroides TaxID=46969 RepID=A0A7J6V0I1_THATH|nr:Pheromone receptor-like protein [Thalictrum thalictroides]
MVMEVILPIHSSSDFNFDSVCSTPMISAPSSPKRFGEFYFSAPNSPNRLSSFYRDFNNSRGNGSVIPYDWEEKPGTPKFKNNQVEEDDDDVDEFEFGFSGQLDRNSLSAADELFDGGKIKPLKPPPRLQLNNDFGFQKSSISSPKSPIAQGKKIIREVFSPKKKKDINPFAVAIEESRKGGVGQQQQQQQQRGRDQQRVSVSPSSSSSNHSNRKGSRSLSPFRSLGFEEQQQNTKPNSSNSKSSSRKWSFKDFLLFRSASEGRASDKDPLRKFSLVSKDVKNSSFRSTDSSGSMRRGGPVSAHELHYKSNRAVSEEMKRKTFLPYKQGLFGWFHSGRP